MGVLLKVYRPADWDLEKNSSAAISDRHDSIVVVNVPGHWQASAMWPAYRLLAHDRYPTHPALVPVDDDGSDDWGQSSGNYAGGQGDAAWTKAVEKIVGGPCDLVPIYDHVERRGA